MIFLVSYEPLSNEVFSWFREDVVQARSRLTNVIFLRIIKLQFTHVLV